MLFALHAVKKIITGGVSYEPFKENAKSSSDGVNEDGVYSSNSLRSRLTMFNGFIVQL